MNLYFGLSAVKKLYASYSLPFVHASLVRKYRSFGYTTTLALRSIRIFIHWTTMNSLRPERHLLSKSTFMKGRQCPKALWLHKKRPDLGTPVSASQQMVFDRGKNV